MREKASLQLWSRR